MDKELFRVEDIEVEVMLDKPTKFCAQILRSDYEIIERYFARYRDVELKQKIIPSYVCNCTIVEQHGLRFMIKDRACKAFFIYTIGSDLHRYFVRKSFHKISVFIGHEDLHLLELKSERGYEIDAILPGDIDLKITVRKISHGLEFHKPYLCTKYEDISDTRGLMNADIAATFADKLSDIRIIVRDSSSKRKTELSLHEIIFSKVDYSMIDKVKFIINGNYIYTYNTFDNWSIINLLFNSLLDDFKTAKKIVNKK